MSPPLDDALGFEEPPWDRPLDPALELQGLPEGSEIAGMFPMAVVDAFEGAGLPSPAPRDRYLPFGFYPQREHVQLLLDACGALFPQKSTRAALRSLGRAAPRALLATTLGKVSLGASTTVERALQAMVDTYPVNLRPCECALRQVSDTQAVVSLRGVRFFLDSHHVGVFEGTMRYAGAQGTVRIRPSGPGAAEFLCTWEAGD